MDTAKIKEMVRHWCEIFPGSCRAEVVIAPFTSYRVGGKADALILPQRLEILSALYRQCRQEEIPCFVLGEGANILVHDEGFRGAVFLLETCCNQLYHENQRLYVGAGITVRKLVEYCEENSLEGLDFMSGIPGSVGGALTMNAGAFVGEIGDRVIHIDALNRKGEKVRIAGEDAGFGYRRADGLKEMLLLGCWLKMDNGERNKLRAAREQYLERRAAKQPLEYPSCGSVFKRPPGDYAGRLVEGANCKGLRIGGAMVSPKHANFIVNVDNATAQDIYDVIHAVQMRVYQHFKIWLQLEVKLIGFSEELVKRVETP